METYRLLTDHLSGYCRVVAPDFPGFGGSEEPPVPWDVDGYVDFTLKFAAALGIERAVLMGHFLRRSGDHQADEPPWSAPRGAENHSDGRGGHQAEAPPSYYWKVYSFKAAKAFFRLPGVRRLFPDAVEKARAKRGSADYRSASPLMAPGDEPGG